MTTLDKQTGFDAGSVSVVIQHELWDGNVHDHSDQGVAILIVGQVEGRETTLLRFNCFDIERSYIYGPEGKNKLCRMDPTVDGNPISWTLEQLKTKLPDMLKAAGYEEVAGQVDQPALDAQLQAIASTARDLFASGRNTVKHNRGTDIFEAGNFRFGLEMRKQAGGDGGLAIHVLADLAGSPGRTYVEETELLAFDCFREFPHYHYGPRNKNHRIFWDKTVVPDTLEWTLEVVRTGKLRDMIERAGYPGVAADYDQRVVDEVFPELAKRAREIQAQPLPEKPTPNLVPR
ncbi:DUF7700 domain-containing protein [Candidatus Entotheonella palauensis]|uniref:DUF7700 domain-containing protein n=1 Tax=Candidatus Entotheonella gemina TaxID=1429439 RepID=W4LZN3_9BACT|nr:hypothetical protein [Candidatus Entotheonella palauensis]ETX03353.1 MAG: hypothetical protein ETSY2_33710 [Candidatus Entotheonella gemina]